MLGDYPIDVVLLATDLGASRDFYRDKIGLQIVTESPNAVTFKCGGGNQLAISKCDRVRLHTRRFDSEESIGMMWGLYGRLFFSMR